jgi:hypothetical protein
MVQRVVYRGYLDPSLDLFSKAQRYTSSLIERHLAQEPAKYESTCTSATFRISACQQ